MKSTTMKNTFLLAVALCLAMMASASDGYTIYPVPQRQEAGSGVARFTSTVVIIAEPGIDEVTVARAKQVLGEHGFKAEVGKSASKGTSALMLGVNGSHGVAEVMLGRRAGAVESQREGTQWVCRLGNCGRSSRSATGWPRRLR